MSTGMHQELHGVADGNGSLKRIEEKLDVNVNDGESSVERLMQEKDLDSSLFTSMNEASVPTSVERQVPFNTSPLGSPILSSPSPLQLVYLQPTQNGVSIIPYQVAGHQSFTPHYPTGVPANLQPGPPHLVPPPFVYDSSCSYTPPTYPYGSTNLSPHFMQDPTFTNQPLHVPTSPLQYPVNGFTNPQSYPVYLPSHLPTYPVSIPSNLAPLPVSVSVPTNQIPYPVSLPINPTQYPQNGPINQVQIFNPPCYSDLGPTNYMLPQKYQDTPTFTPSTTTVVQSSVKKSFFRPWEGDREGEHCPQQSREKDQPVIFGEEDFPALNKEFNKLMIKK